MRDAPVADAQPRSVLFHRVVKFLCSEALEGDLKCVKSDYYLIDKVSVEFSDEDGGGDLLSDEVSHSSHNDDIINLGIFLREYFLIIIMINDPVLFDKFESLALLAVNEKVVASTVERLDMLLRGYTSKDALADYTDSIAKDIGFLH